MHPTPQQRPSRPCFSGAVERRVGQMMAEKVAYGLKRAGGSLAGEGSIPRKRTPKHWIDRNPDSASVMGMPQPP
jgi:hypothetical protein